VERPPHPDPLHSPSKTGVNALMASGERGKKVGANMLFLDAPGLADGFVRPLLAPAHLLSLIGLGLLAGRASLPALIAIAAGFVVGLAGGLGAIAWGIGETPANDALFAAAGACGALAALAAPIPVRAAAWAALIIGCAVGLDSPPEAISLGEAVLTLVGTGCGAVAGLVLMTAAAALIRSAGWSIALRVAGSWLAAIAVLVLALRWRG
jgi:urease accessory protein